MGQLVPLAVKELREKVFLPDLDKQVEKLIMSTGWTKDQSQNQ